MVFITRCVEARASDMMDMEDRARAITRRTFLKYVDRDVLKVWEVALGYASHPSQGLTMAGDWHVTYYKSTYRGRLCVGFDWSCIDHLFCLPEDLPRLAAA